MKKRLQLLFNSLLLLTVLVCSTNGQAQLNYTQNFNGEVPDWSTSGFYISDIDDELACEGISVIGNFYFYPDPDFGDYGSNAEVTTSSLGISNGQLATLTYSYKILDFFSDEAVPNTPNWGDFTISYGLSEDGPWTTIQTVNNTNHVVSADCAVKTATFTPPVGMEVFLKVVANYGGVDETDVKLYMDDLTLTQPSVACTGAPAAISATAASSTVCNTQAVSLAFTPAITSAGITYQWQSSTDNVTYTNITGATLSTYSATQPGTRWYRVIATCTASTLSTTSTAVQVTSTGLPCVCDVTFPAGVEPITNVTIGPINNTTSDSTTSPERETFTTGTAPILIKGITYPVSLQGNTNGPFTTYFKVFIDFNQNGNLDDADESFEMGSIFDSTGLDGQAATGNITIPADALSGQTFMRVIKRYSAYPESACNDSGYGQAEDYLINIQPCTTTAPTAAATQTFCGGATVNDLAVTGTSVKWYTAATGGNSLPTAAALVNTTYYASQTSGGCEGPRTAVVVTVNTPLADDPIDQTVCGTYTLPALTNGTYRTALNGGGTVVAAGTVITETTTLYVYGTTDTTPACSVDNAFTITITTGVTADEPENVVACTSYTLPALSENNTYHTAANGGGTVVDAGTVITADTTLYVYATTSGTNPCTDESTFTITIVTALADAPDDVTVCSPYTLPALTNGAYYTAANGGGTVVAAGTVIGTTTTLYVYAQTVSGTTTCTTDNSFTVNVDLLEVDELDDVTVCGEYILPEITNGTYYSGANGLGDMYEAGDAITETATLHIFVQQGTCTAESNFTVNILNVEPVTMPDVVTCDSYELPVLPAGSTYYTASGGLGESLQAGQPIDANTTIYIQTVSNSTPACTTETSFDVTINTVEALEDQTYDVSVNQEDELLTLADYDLDAEGTIDWYPNEDAANNQTPLLSLATEIPMGTTVYYVRHRMGDCVSEPSTVTFTVTLGTDKFDAASFSYHPNPVNDILNLSYSQNMTQVTVYNLLGQQIAAKQVNDTTTQIDLSQLASGTYLVKVQTENASKVIKIIKNR